MKLFSKDLLTIQEGGHKLKFFEIALSKMSEMVFIYFLSTIQTAMVAGYSQDATSIVGICGQVSALCSVIFTLITLGTSINMSVSLGQGKRDNANILAGTAMYICIGLALVFSVMIYIFAPKILTVMNVDSSMLDTTIKYLRIISVFFTFLVFLTYLNNTLICEGYSSKVLISNTVNSILLILFCYIALYSNITLFNDKILTLGVFSCLPRFITIGMALYFMKKYKCAFSFKFGKRQAKDILRMGVPSGMNSVSYQIAQLVTTSFIAYLGAAIFNTKVYVANIIVFSHIISWSVAQATGVFMGRYRGMGEYDKIERMHRQNVIIAVLGNVIVSAIVYLLRVPLMGIFTSDAESIKLAGTVILIDLFVEAARAVNHINEQALSSNGDVKMMLIASVISCWMFGILFAYILGIKLGLGLVGVWIGFFLEEGFKTVAYSLRWKSKKWMLTNIGK